MKEVSSYTTCCFSLKSIDASPEESHEQRYANAHQPLYTCYREQHGWDEIRTTWIEPQNKGELAWFQHNIHATL